MSLETVIQSAGPLPVAQIFTPAADGPVVFIVTATAWTQSAPGMIGYQLLLNGEVIGSCGMFANQNAVHMTLPTLCVNAMIPSNQPQKVAVVPVGTTVTDGNDFFSVQMLY